MKQKKITWKQIRTSRLNQRIISKSPEAEIKNFDHVESFFIFDDIMKKSKNSKFFTKMFELHVFKNNL